MALNLSALGYREPLKKPINKGLNFSALAKNVTDFITNPTPFQFLTKKAVEKVTPFVKDIGQEIARNIGSAGVTLAKPITKRILPEEKGVDVVEVPKFLQGIFKDEPIKSVELRIAEAETKVKEWGEKEKKYSALGKLAFKFPEELAFAGVVGSVGLDLLPVGGTRKGATEAIKGIKKVDDAIELLLKMGVEDDLAKHFAKEVVKTKSDDVAKKLLTHIAEVNKTTKKTTGLVTDALKPAKTLDEVFEVQKAVPEAKTVDPLIQEAKKYPTVEKYIEAQTVVYHGTDSKELVGQIINKQGRNELGNGLYFFEEGTENVWGRNKLPISVSNINFKKYISMDNYLKDVNKYGKVIDIQSKLNLQKELVQSGYDGISIKSTLSQGRKNDIGIIFNESISKIKTKSQLTDIFNKAQEVEKPIKKVDDIEQGLVKIMQQEELRKAELELEPSIFKGELENQYDNFVGVMKSLKKNPKLREKIDAGDVDTFKRIASEKGLLEPDAFGNADLSDAEVFDKFKSRIMKEEPELLSTKKAVEELGIQSQITKIVKEKTTAENKALKIKQDVLDNIDRRKGNTEKIIEFLKKKGASDDDIANIVLEDGTKLVDTVKVKRNADKSLASVITKQQIKDVKVNYKGGIPGKGWIKKSPVKATTDLIGEGVNYYELPALYFERKGLQQIYDPIIESFRGAEELNNSFIKRFKDAKLFKEGGWFTADRFKLSKKESDNIGKYFLSRQGKGYSVKLEDLSKTEKKFVEIFDGIIKDTEPRFYEVAKKNGKTPGKVDNYAPIMTRDDIELIDKGGVPMDFIVRKHPAFFSLKQRAEKVPKELYETDYRKVAARWMSGVSKFNVVGDTAPDIKYLLDSEQFQSLISKKDYEVVAKWYKDTINPDTPHKVADIPRFLRKATSVASLGLNYASVVKQALTQIPLTIIEKAPPKISSKFAKEFGISVKELPSLTTRKGSVAIQDLQGKLGRIFTGALTEFDKTNAQASLNALLDKNYKKFLKEGVEVSPEIQAEIIKKSQDTLDLWYGGMVSKAQYPPAFRTETGKFINMFIYPLTSQLNGFFRTVYKAKGVMKFEKMAEVAAAAVSIAYMEQAISQLSPKWSDDKQMAIDVTQSLAGNIPIVSQLSYALATEQPIQVSAGVSGISQLVKKFNGYRKGTDELNELVFASAELVGLPKQIRKVKEGLEIIEKGGITDKNGKMLAPVKDTDEIIRSVLRGKYGSMAAKDWIRNIATKTEDRRWFVPQVEFLQNGDYERKAEIYNQFSEEDKKYLRDLLSDGQEKKLFKALLEKPTKQSLDDIFSEKKSLESIFQ